MKQVSWQRPLNGIVIILLGIVLAGCHESSVGHYEEPHPNIRSFEIIDTYGTNSNFSPVSSLAISPYVNGGDFDLLWDIHSHQDYWVDIYVNSGPFLTGGQWISSTYCGPGLACDYHPVAACTYTDTFDVICEDANGDIQGAAIDHLITSVPQTLYFILDTCDVNFDNCEYQAIPVLME